VIYVAAWGPYVKVGASRNPERRMLELPYGSPQTPRLPGHPTLIGAVEGDRRGEALLHAALTEHRVIGEWYDGAAPAVIAVVTAASRRPPTRRSPA